MSKNETGIFPYQTKKGTKYKVHFQYKEYGITKRYQKAGFSSKKEAKNHLILKKAEINEKGTLTIECKKTFKEVYDEFLQIGTTKYKPNTIYNTVKYCNYVEDLYDYRISLINYSLLQNYFNNRSHIGIETNKCLKKALNRVFNYAVDCGYISINPLSKVVVQGVENHMEHDEVLSFDDFTKMINTLEESGKFNQRAYSIAMQIGYYMGLRVSEVMALDKSDIDLDNDLLDINKSLIYRGLKKDELYISNQLKSEASKAILPIPQPLKKSLVEWFKINPYDIAVCDKNGKHIDPDIMSSYLRKVGDRLGIYFHFHMLRHTCSTNLYNSGMDPKKVQTFMRHSSMNTTMMVYTHVDQNDLRDAINNVFH